MPNIKSAKKRVVVSQKNAERNKAKKSALKTQLKKANAAIAENTADKQEVVKATVKMLDQAAASGLIHKNNAANKKSALTKKANA